MSITSSATYLTSPSCKTTSLQKSTGYSSNSGSSLAPSHLEQDAFHIRFGADVHVSRSPRGGGGGDKEPNRNTKPTAEDETTGVGSKKKKRR